jgi:CubicO group peptidase (beta-lactamase class C family)
MKRFFGVFALAAIFASGLSAQTFSNGAAADLSREQINRIDGVFKQYDRKDTPGCALAIVKDGKVVYKHGYGMANLEYDIPITPSTVFHTGSVSKQFTAFAIALLASEGKLNLNDDVRKYLPEVPDFGKIITIKHLLYHTSGLRDQWELLAMAGWRLDDVITQEHILKMVQHQKALNFDPGSEQLYSNTGYTLLAVIVERVSGLKFRLFTMERIFKPLGMTTTHFHDDHEMVVKNRAYAYAPGSMGSFKLTALNYSNVGATSLFTTAEDMTKWALNFDDPKVGGKAVIDRMLEQGFLNNGTKINYAFGLQIGKYKGFPIVEHGGTDAGYRSQIIRFPEQRMTIIVHSNHAMADPGDLSRKVADVFLPDAPVSNAIKPAPIQRTEVKISPSLLDRYVGTYELGGVLTAEVIKENDQLMAVVQGQKLELFPESETKFFLRVMDAQIEFQKDEKGQFTQITGYQNDQVLKGKRIIPASNKPQDLSEYAGDYYSEELGTAYRIVLIDGKLVAQHRRNSDIPLAPKTKDVFNGGAWFFSNVTFTRDKDNHVDGLTVSGSRVKNLRFDRQPRQGL